MPNLPDFRADALKPACSPWITPAPLLRGMALLTPEIPKGLKYLSLWLASLRAYHRLPSTKRLYLEKVESLAPNPVVFSRNPLIPMNLNAFALCLTWPELTDGFSARSFGQEKTMFATESTLAARQETWPALLCWNGKKLSWNFGLQW
jgi:hypothetical protein